MKRYLTVLIAVVLISSPGLARSLEKSGEVIRELMNDIDDQMNSMEEKSKVLTKSRKSLLNSLQKDFAAFEVETDPGDQELLAADMQLSMVKLNVQEVREVEIYIGTLDGLIPNVGRVEKEMASGGSILGADTDFSAYQVKMGTFMSRAVDILDGIKQGASREVQQEIAGLEALLVSTYITLSPKSSKKGAPLEQLKEVKSALENALLQLINIKRLLAQERMDLETSSQVVMGQLVLRRLGEGPLSNSRFFTKPGAIKKSLQQRQQIREKIQQKAYGSTGNKGGGFLTRYGPQDKNILGRIRRGDYDWNRREKP